MGIRVVILEPARLARRLAPALGGIPADPALPPDGPWRLWAGAVELPVQVTRLRGRTPWLLVETQAILAASERLVCELVADPSAPAVPALTPAFPPVTLSVTDALGQMHNAGAAAFVRESAGPLRVTERWTGPLGTVPGLGFTLRRTAFRDHQYVRYDLRLRNSRPDAEQYLKLTSAVVRIGPGDPLVARAPGFGLGTTTLVQTPGVTYDMIPAQQRWMRDPAAGLAWISVAAAGGYLLYDLAHLSQTLWHDPAKELTLAEAQNPVPILLEDRHGYFQSGNLSLPGAGTYEDEQELYRRWGWSWTWDQTPHDPFDPDRIVSIGDVDVHGDTESDDLFQNVLMWLRTGSYPYWQKARAWARFFEDEMLPRTDGFAYAWDASREGTRESGRLVTRPLASTVPLTASDQDYRFQSFEDGRLDIRTQIACHVWGYGLADWYCLTGDPEALDALLDGAEICKRIVEWRPGYVPTYGSRDIARWAMLLIRAWDMTDDPAWRALADHVIQLINASPQWDEPLGILYRVETTKTGEPAISPHHIADLFLALDRYARETGDAETRRRTMQLIAFARRWSLDPIWGQTNGQVWLDLAAHTASQRFSPVAEPTVNPWHTQTWVNLLVRGYELTGDRAYLERARRHWTHYSKCGYLKPATWRLDQADLGARVGRFMNARHVTDDLYFEFNGDWMSMLLPAHVADWPAMPEVPARLPVVGSLRGGG